MKHSTLPVVLSTAVVGICFALGASSSAPEGTALADLPGSARLYTAEQVAALFSTLDGTNAAAALERILRADEDLYTNLLAVHRRDLARTSWTNLVLDPYDDFEVGGYGSEMEPVYVHNVDSGNRVVVLGNLRDAVTGLGDEEWAYALQYANDLRNEFNADGFYPVDIAQVVQDSAMRISRISDDDYFDLMAASQDLVSLAGESATLLSLAQNPPQGCTCDPASVNSRLAALEARPTCGCNLSDISAVVSDLENALSALQAVAADLSSVSSSAADLESRLSAIESALQSLSPQEVAERTGSPVEVVEETIDRAQQDAAAAADDVTAIADAASEIESFGDAVDDVAEEVDAIVDILGEV